MFIESQSLRLFAVLCLAACSVFGQAVTSLTGIVTDPAGAAIPNAQVAIANQETGLNRRTATTTEAGDYVFTSLTPGVYRVTVEVPGFKISVRERLKLDVGETQEVKIDLEVGSAQETVTHGRSMSSSMVLRPATSN